MSGKRSIYIDALKGYAILLVVIGHAIQRAAFLGLISWGTLSEYLPYSGYVTMPLFFAISGYLSFGRVHAPVGRWLLGKARMLLVPLVAWTVIYYFTVHDRLIPTDMPFASYLRSQVPLPTLWFLLVLFYCYALLATQHRFGDWLMAVAGLAVAVVFDRWLHPLDWYWPWFVAGYFFSRYRDRLQAGVRYLWPLAAAAYAFAVFRPVTSVEGWPRVVFPLAAIGVSTLVVFALRSLPVMEWLAVLGKRSMTIYVGQFLFVQLVIAHSWKNIPVVTVLAVAGSLLIDRIFALHPWTNAMLLGARGLRVEPKAETVSPA